MRAPSVIIITSDRWNLTQPALLDRLIHDIVGMKRNPILLLGPDGDEFLRTCSRLDDCEMVFDPNYEGELFSSIKAGLQATHAASFILPLGVPLLPLAQWEKLERELLLESQATAAQQSHVIRPMTHANVEIRFPQLITAPGAQVLRALRAQTSWEKSEGFVVRTVELESSPNSFTL